MNFQYSKVEQQQNINYVLQTKGIAKPGMDTTFFTMIMQIELNLSNYAASDSHSPLSTLFHVR